MENIERLSKLLSHGSQEVRVKGPWSRLLPEIHNIIGESCTAIGLWLIDQDPETGHSITLWGWRDLRSETKPSNISIDSEIIKSAVPPDALKSIIQDHLQFITEQTGQTLPREFFVAPLETFGQNDEGTEPGEKRKTIGCISFHGLNENAFDKDTRREIEIITTFLASWMHLNREWRKSTAVSEFQKARRSADNPITIGENACSVLTRYASANLAAVIYVTSGTGLKKLSENMPHDSGVHQFPTDLNRNHIISQFHFADKGDPRVNCAEWRFDASGACVSAYGYPDGSDIWDFPEIGIRDEPVTIIMRRIRDRRRVSKDGTDTRPVIATLIMACRARDTFIGGRFSQTNKGVMRLVTDAFRESYCLDKQRQVMKDITQRIEKITDAAEPMKVMDSAHDNINFSPYAELVASCLPSIVDAWIVTLDTKNGVEHLWTRQGDLELTAVERERYALAERFIDGDRRQIQTTPPLWQTCYEIHPGPNEKGSEKVFLISNQSVEQFAFIEDTLFDRITSEIKIRYNTHIDKEDWARQLAQVRHNMRVIIASIISKTEAVSDRFFGVKHKAEPSENKEIVYDRLIREAEFHKSFRLLHHHGVELQSIFENIRTLVGRFDEHSLQISKFDLVKQIYSILKILETYAEERGLNIYFNPETTKQTRRVNADRNWTKIALYNVIENAIKYSNRNGVIRINLKDDKAFWILTVTNYGRYIPENKREEIFEPFTRIIEEVPPGVQVMPGTGLGLMTVKRYVELHQSKHHKLVNVKPISVSSTKTGQLNEAVTSFTLRVPRAGP